MIDRPDWGSGGEHRNGAAVVVHEQQTHERLVAEIASSDGPAPSAPATVDKSAKAVDKSRDASGRFTKEPTKVVRDNWGNPNQEIAPAGEEVIPGVGVGACSPPRCRGCREALKQITATCLKACWVPVTPAPIPRLLSLHGMLRPVVCRPKSATTF